MSILSQVHPLFFALAATISFSYASTIFTEFSRSITPEWMNAFKAVIALIFFSLTLFFTNVWITPVETSVYALLASGLLGLMIGDMYMLKAMRDLGASRMLMIFGMQPFFLGLAEMFIFGKDFLPINFLGGALMLGCLYTISFENYKKSGSWQIVGLTYGIVAILLDGTGLLLTKYAFNTTNGITSIQVNVIRCIGACAGFLLYHYSVKRLPLVNTFKKLPPNKKVRLLIGSIGGTYLSLMLYLQAISMGLMVQVSSITITGPMFAQIFECINQRKLPNRLVFLAFSLFAGGFYIFIFHGKGQ